MPIPAKLAKLEEKWAKKVTGKADDWAAGVKGSTDRYIKGLAEKLGIPEDEVRNGPMARAFAEFASNPEEYKEFYRSGVEAAKATHKWAEGMYRKVTGRRP